MSRIAFVMGGTGFLGAPLISLLRNRGYVVRALVRPELQHKLPHDCEVILGNALDPTTFSCGGADVFIQLSGASGYLSSKGDRLKSLALVSVSAAVTASIRDRVRHFVYVSVAQPAPVRKDYVAVRREGEKLIADSRLRSTVLRPWYVLGPGRHWPRALYPLYRVAEQLPPTRDSALRLGLVTREQMVAALVWGVENPPVSRRVLEVPDIRAIGPATLKAVS